MTAALLAQIPAQVGSTLLNSVSRVALFALQRYMKAPLAHTAIGALVALSALAASNVLFFQQHAHPAPLFGFEQSAETTGAIGAVEPVVPRARPKSLGQSGVTTPSVAPHVEAQPARTVEEPAGPIGNKDVVEVQRKLEMMKLFSGTIDGYYGPQTARAIKKFEELKGLKPKGQLTHEIIEMIRSAPMTLGSSTTVPTPSPAAALPQVAPLAAAAPAQPMAEIQPEHAKLDVPAVRTSLQTPAPLDSGLQTGSVAPRTKAETAPTLLGRPVPQTPQAALSLANRTANEAIDTIVSGVQGLANGEAPSGPQPARYAEATQHLPAIVEPAAVSTPTPGVPLQVAEPAPLKSSAGLAVLDTDARPEDLMPPFSVTDPVMVAKVQRGLASLGFLHGPADGVAGDATAKAIRNFEVYFNYKVTGRISPELLDLLAQNGAAI